jgi:hypothetical protein
MFSIIPKTGTLMASDKNIETPFLASAKATACGVLTTTTPLLAKPAQWKDEYLQFLEANRPT